MIEPVPFALILRVIVDPQQSLGCKVQSAASGSEVGRRDTFNWTGSDHAMHV